MKDYFPVNELVKEENFVSLLFYYGMITMTGTYIIELKYLKADATDAEAEAQWRQAESQIRSYGQSSRVHLLTGGTQLHLVIIQFRGLDVLRLDEIGL